MINPLGNQEEYNHWKKDLSLDNYYEIDHLRKDRYK